MGSFIAFVITGLALAVALASWIAGAVFYGRTVVGHRRWLAFVCWPFLLHGDSDASQAQHINKALVAFIASLMVAAAAFSVATNLSRVAR